MSNDFNYESEMAFVIGKRARHVSVADALDYVAGYTIFNDGSIRDVQLRTPQWTIGKNFDGTGGMGPDFVTSDELPPGCAGLHMQGRFNGEVVQDTTLSDLIFDVPNLVSLISAAMTLEPGDVISTGTPSGVGLSFKPPNSSSRGTCSDRNREDRHIAQSRRREIVIQSIALRRNAMSSLIQQMGHIVISSPDPLGAAKDLQETVGLRDYADGRRRRVPFQQRPSS